MRTTVYDEILAGMTPGMKRSILRIVTKCVGRENRIKKDEIARLMHLKYTSTTDRQIRSLVNELRKEGVLILSDSGGAGYWLAENRDEVDEVLNELNSRAKDLLEQSSILRLAAERELGMQMGLGI